MPLPAIEIPSIPHLPLINVILRIIEGVCAFFSLMLISKTCAVESYYYGEPSSTPSWTVFVGIYSFVVISIMLGIPFIHERTGRFKRAARFLIKPRSTFVLTTFNLGLWFIAVVTLSVYTNDASHCSVADGDPLLKEKGPNYRTDVELACSIAKASEAFAWIGFFAWIGSLAIAGKIFYDEKQSARRHPKPDNMSFMQARENSSSLDRSNTRATALSEDLESQSSPYTDHAQPMVQMHPLPQLPLLPSSDQHQPPVHDYYGEPVFNQPITPMPIPVPMPVPTPMPIPPPAQAPIPPPHPTGYIPGPFARPETGPKIEYV